MTFSPNSSLLYLIAVCIILFVLVQSVFFLVRAWRRARQLGIDVSKLKKTVASTAVFTIAPAISFLLGVVALSKFLGIPLPWIRMSVIGAITYELPAATSAAGAFGIEELSKLITDPKVYAAIAWVMTLGILPSIILPPILMKKIQGGVVKMKQKDEKWGGIFMDSLFLGMISAFLGMVFADIRSGLVGFLPIFVLLASAAAMALCGILIKKCGIKWLETYAMSISMLVGMVAAAVIAPLVGYIPEAM